MHLLASTVEFSDMSMLAYLLFLIVACATAQVNEECPTWHWHSSTGCKCSSRLGGAILCVDQRQVHLRVDYCMTLDSSSNLTVVAICHRSYHDRQNTIGRGVYALLPNNSHQLQETQCTPNNREGLLCAECIGGYGVSVTTLTPKCIDCSKHSPFIAVLLYLTLELLPITVFFAIIVTFHINIMSGPLMGYFIFCQVHAITTNQLFEFFDSILTASDPFTTGLLNISHILSSLWTLSSFNILPPICISHNISFMDAVLLKYLLVLYSLGLVPLTFICIELHGRHFKPIVYLWKPFKKCFIKVRRNWNASDSIIHAYATLFFLSFAVLNYISFKLLNVTDLILVNGKQIENRLISDPTIRRYSSTHAPYAATAYGFLFLLGFCPAFFLCLYPVGIFRKLFELTVSTRKRIILNTFVETLHGGLKDGLNGTRDCRSLLGITMVATMFVLLFNAHDTGHYSLSAIVITTCVLILFSLVIAHIRPCKTSLANISLSFHTALGGTICLLMSDWIIDSNLVLSKNIVKGFAILIFLPHFLIALWLGYNIIIVVFSKVACLQNVKTSVVTFFKQKIQRRAVEVQEYTTLPE